MNRLMLPPTQNESTITICITDVLGDKFCVVCEDGKRVYENVATALKTGKKVHLSFRGGEDITSAFLAEAFSRLYANFSEEQIETNLSFTDIDPDDAADIKCVIQDVKDYLNNPQQFKNAIIEAMGEDAI
ncbi:MAG: STAS-like domain-containing protein [Calothrix sp. C42_A2020_038]|nr:STAS-like domain-containing protein [Calothrix sp. C42_A2020_038]